MIEVTCPLPFRGAMVVRAFRPNELILFDAVSRSPGPFGVGEGLGLVRRGLTRAGAGLTAGLSALERIGLLIGRLASLPPLLGTGAGVMRDR